MKNINICIIPAAGKGSRWAPLSSHSPKEMVPLIGKPVIDWVITEVINSGCDTIIVVINNQKQVIKNYLEDNKEFAKKVKFYFVYQEQPLGITDTIVLSQQFIEGKPFALALPDLPTISKKPTLSQLIKAFEQTGKNTSLTSFSKFPNETLRFYSECLVKTRKDKLLDIIHFCPKDKSPHHKNNKLRMSGRYVFTPNVLKIANELMKNNKGSEVNDVTLLQKLMEHQQVLGVNIEGKTYDTGNPELYARTNVAFNLKYNPNYKKLIR